MWGPLKFHDGRRGIFLFKYEEMVDGRFGALEEYVGVPLEGQACVLDRYYGGADWELNPSPAAAAEHSTRYVERIVNDRRAALKLPPFR